MTFVIGCDAGHWLKVIGKETPDKEKEWSFNDVLIKAFISELKNYEDVKTIRYDDPTGKKDVLLKTRTDKANKDKVDLYISFHHNANAGKWGSHTGTEVHVYKTKPAEAVKLAKMLAPEVAKAYGLKDRGIKYTDLHITRETNMTSVLIEGGFMDSTIDIKKLRDQEVLKKAGKAIAQTVAKFAGLKKKKEEPKPVAPKPASPKPVTPKPAPSKELYKVIADGKQTGAFSDINNAMSQAKKDLEAGKDITVKKD